MEENPFFSPENYTHISTSPPASSPWPCVSREGASALVQECAVIETDPLKSDRGDCYLDTHFPIHWTVITSRAGPSCTPVRMPPASIRTRWAGLWSQTSLNPYEVVYDDKGWFLAPLGHWGSNWDRAPCHAHSGIQAD